MNYLIEKIPTYIPDKMLSLGASGPSLNQTKEDLTHSLSGTLSRSSFDAAYTTTCNSPPGSTTLRPSTQILSILDVVPRRHRIQAACQKNNAEPREIFNKLRWCKENADKIQRRVKGQLDHDYQKCIASKSGAENHAIGMIE